MSRNRERKTPSTTSVLRDGRAGLGYAGILVAIGILAVASLSGGCGNSYRVHISEHFKDIHKIAVIDVGEGEDVDKQIADYITNEFISTGLEVIERSYLAKLLSEHDVNTADFIDSASVSKYGKMLGVDAIAMHKVMEFEEHGQHEDHGLFAPSPDTREYHVMGFLRVVDVERARIVLAATSNFKVRDEHKSEAFQVYAIELVRAINEKARLSGGFRTSPFDDEKFARVPD